MTQRNDNSKGQPLPENPVLFVYIGWSEGYDGKPVEGTHGWLRANNGDDCSEMEAFVKRKGMFTCGIGGGSPGVDMADVVFVAKPPGDSVRRVVGVYFNAEIKPWHVPSTNKWRGASTKQAVLIPEPHRFVVPEWPGSSGLRRWAYGERALPDSQLLGVYWRVIALTKSLATGKQSEPVDEELEAFEGKLRSGFIQHRPRERKMRDAKIRAVLQAKGRLECEVPGCGFDFHASYGEFGKGFAHVHHTEPLASASPLGRGTKLQDLAIVCANCHAVIHRGGACRRLSEIGSAMKPQPRSRKALR